MPIILDVLAIILALKLAEATGGLEFDSSGSLFGATLVCWLGGWGTSAAIGLILPDAESLRSSFQSLWLLLGIQLGIQVVASMVQLLVAWAVVPGVHVRRFSGLLIASILFVGVNYAASTFIFRLSVGL